MKKGTVKQRLISALLAMVMLITSLIGTTFSWFTDTKTSEGNIIEAGTLKLDLIHKTASGDVSLKDKSTHKIFDYDKWEPGYTRIETLEVMNLGTLAFKYRLSLEVADNTAVLGDNGEFLGDVIDVYVAYGDVAGGTVEEIAASSAWVKKGTLTEVLNNPYSFISGQLLPNGRVPEANSPAHTEVGRQTLKIALHMNKKAGNDYQDLSVGDVYVNLKATQYDYENDSFGNGYDSGAGFPSFSGDYSASASVNVNASGALVDEVTLKSGNEEITAIIPAGTSLIDGTTTVTLDVTTLNSTKSNVELYENEILNSVDVHVSGIKEGNATPILVTVKKLLAPGLNMGNFALYHVEDGVTVKMTYEDDLAALDAHNEFIYDPATGDVTMALCSFSEIALVANTVNAWNGTVATAFAGGSGTEDDPYLIANADQLAYFGAVVGGMKGDENGKTFEGEYIKLIADINLGDKESENNPDLIFYPIGYYNSEGTYEKTGTAITSGLRKFSGIFDGNGNTISNFYHNTWEMKGDNEYYAASEQYYRDGMGLFGKIYKGTVKNLTVKNFSSDGEYTTTGVIAAYADGATFENIAISDCNPRVYNIGNGGIVGCVGWYAQEVDLKTTFTNITVDNSNKISALWGSYDVACGGIAGQYYPTSGQTSAGTPKNAGIEFVNCHVSAQMDVYNDVCANYQYYAYRYTGMLIGSVRENETIDGHVYPKMDGITASGCTVHFGTWNDYYYCEIIDNTIASYTHDYQMSRLTEIKAIDGTTITYLDGTTGTVPASGRANYVIVDYTKGHGTDNATCYHFKDGKVWNHSDAGEEMVDGVKVLVEDKQHLYLEFNNLVTGYGWGVTSRSLTNLNGVTNLDVTSGDQEASVEKFDVLKSELTNNREYKLSAIFAYLEDCGVKLVPGALTVGIANLDENGNVSAEIDYDRDNWENSTIKFSGTGNIKLTIQDYYFCTPTELTVNITERQPEVKFDVVMNNGDFLHRVGNSGTVALDRLFKAKDGVEIGTVSVTVEAIDNTSASGEYSNNAIQFSGTGVVKVTVTDNDYCIPTELYLEVVDAVNATTATSATENNVVLLKDISGTFSVSGNYTVFGNGFTLNYDGNGQYLNNGLRQGVVNVSENGRLDNLRIKASIYPSSYLYYDEVKNGPYTKETAADGTEKTRYHYQLSAVVAKDNATISNCYIYGGRNNIFVGTGNVTITDTVTECGTLANIQIQSTEASTVTLNNVTTIQYRVNATVGDSTQVMMGAGVIVGPDAETNPKLVITGDFKQYNWVTADDKEEITNSTAKTIIQTALDATAFNHTVNGKTASNLGIIYLNNADAEVTNDTDLLYAFGNVEMLNQSGKVYSLQNAGAGQIYSDYEKADRSTVNGDYLPTFEFDLGDQEISYDGSEDTRYLYGDANGITALYKDGEEPLTLDLTKLATIYKYEGIPYTVTAVCKNASGIELEQNNGVVTLDAQGDYTIMFTVTDNIFYDKDGQTINKSVNREFSVPLKLAVKAADIKNAIVNITKTALDGVYTTVNLTDYKLRINFLDCISITDYDNKGTGTTVNLTSNISSATLTPSGVNVFTTAATITVTYTDGRVLTVNISKISGSSAGTKTANVNTSGGLYFITDGALNDKPTEVSSQNICTITSVSYKGNSGSTVTNDTDVTVTWALGSSSGGGGCVTGDTLVTLADGTQKRVYELNGSEMLLVWDFYKGEYTVSPVGAIINHGYDIVNELTLRFADGTAIKTMKGHGFYDILANKFVIIDEFNVSDYVGHEFVKYDASGTGVAVELVDYSVESRTQEVWTLVSAIHFNCVLNGLLTLSPTDFPDSPAYLMPFEIGCGMKYDEEKMLADIEFYGQYNYEEFAEYCTYEQFVGMNFANWKVAVDKGYIKFEDIIYLIRTYLGN